MRLPTPSPTWLPRGIDLSDAETVDALAYILETQFQPVTDFSVLTGVQIFDVALRSYFLNSASEPKITNPAEVNEAIKYTVSGMLQAQTVSRTGL
jgi:hypothetical protein